MECYRDMCFCSYSDCRKFGTCFRAATDLIKDNAVAFGLPICYFDGKPECFEVKK